jgi:hypothetical protein
MKRTLGIVLVVCALVACKKEGGGGDGKSPDLPASRAAAAGDFPDSPQLQFVPADTPYAFATFKPVPMDYFRKWGAIMSPALSKLRATPGESGDKMRAILDEIGGPNGTFDLKHFEELGFSAKARMVVYGGMGVYPVARIEIADGDKVFALVQRIAKRWGEDLPAAVEANGHRHWIIDAKHDVAAVVGISKSELVFAFAPRALIDQNIGQIMGDQKPAKAIATSQFKDIAQRDGYSAQGVGFVDTGKLIGAVMEIAGTDKPPAACVAAIQTLATGVPRLTIGYDDFTGSKIAFGIVAELAPGVLADAKTLSTKLAGLDKVMKSHPAMGMAAAVDLSKLKGLAPKAALVLRGLGQACQSEEMSSAADSLETKMSMMPPFLDGPAGAAFALNDIKVTGRGMPEKMDGWLALHLKDTGELLSLAKSQLAGMDITADGKPHTLPSMLPFKGHFAANKDTIALALGANSESTVTDALGGTPAPAPLFLMTFDYQKMGEMMAQDPTNTADLEMFKLFGVGVFQSGIDDRGLYMWASIDMK